MADLISPNLMKAVGIPIGF